jgi:hypothetical protein
MAQISNSPWVNIPPHLIRHMGGNAVVNADSWIPEDAEVEDIRSLRQMIDEQFDRMYPRFEPEVIHTLDKDYFLPALKVLGFRDGKFFSPSRFSEWEDMELKATCRIDEFFQRGWLPVHEPPFQDCDCGIYGSVNLDEINEYILHERQNSRETEDVYGFFQDFEVVDDGITAKFTPRVVRKPLPKRSYALCIVEPYPDAEYHLTRKGWKTSRAFISEIIGETMDISTASALLSMAWHRELNLRRLTHENR